ncbi:MAG: spermidine synthase, partial [Ignisphaera sp.]
YRDVYNSIANSIKNVYRYYLEYQVWIPSFGYACNFVLGSKEYNPVERLNKEYIDSILKSRGVETRFINGQRMEALISIGVY